MKRRTVAAYTIEKMVASLDRSMTVKRRAKVHQHASPFGTTLFHAAAETRVQLRQVRDALETILSGESFDQRAIARLARREQYATAAETLQQILQCGQLVSVLFGSHSIFAP